MALCRRYSVIAVEPCRRVGDGEREREVSSTSYSDDCIKPWLSSIILLYLQPESRDLACTFVCIPSPSADDTGPVCFSFHPRARCQYTQTRETHNIADRNGFNFPGRAPRRSCNVQLLNGVRLYGDGDHL